MEISMLIGLAAICASFSVSFRQAEWSDKSALWFGIIIGAIGFAATIYTWVFNSPLILAGYTIFGIGTRAILQALKSKTRDNKIINGVFIAAWICFILLAIVYIIQAIYIILGTSTNK